MVGYWDLTPPLSKRGKEQKRLRNNVPAGNKPTLKLRNGGGSEGNIYSMSLMGGG